MPNLTVRVMTGIQKVQFEPMHWETSMAEENVEDDEVEAKLRKMLITCENAVMEMETEIKNEQ